MINNTIVQFNAELDYDQLEEEFVKGGMDMVKLRYMGDRLAMLTPKEGESMEALWSGSKASLIILNCGMRIM